MISDRGLLFRTTLYVLRGLASLDPKYTNYQELNLTKLTNSFFFTHAISMLHFCGQRGFGVRRANEYNRHGDRKPVDRNFAATGDRCNRALSAANTFQL